MESPRFDGSPMSFVQFSHNSRLRQEKKNTSMDKLSMTGNNGVAILANAVMASFKVSPGRASSINIGYR